MYYLGLILLILLTSVITKSIILGEVVVKQLHKIGYYKWIEDSIVNGDIAANILYYLGLALFTIYILYKLYKKQKDTFYKFIIGLLTIVCILPIVEVIVYKISLYATLKNVKDIIS